MDLLGELVKDEVWDEYLQHKIESNCLSQKEEKQLSLFILNRSYRPLVSRLQNCLGVFDYPRKRSINKSGTNKKRIVYLFSEEETIVLKVVAHLLYRYDDKMGAGCYSFRKNRSAKTAIYQAAAASNHGNYHCIKVDIHNYFNSIPAAKLCDMLESVITDDEKLLAFFKQLLLTNQAYENGVLIMENRGAMAGTPIAPFFANIYLRDLDAWFEKKEIPYFRYSDDILIFADSKQMAEECYGFIQGFLQEQGLELNPDKIFLGEPGEAWEFLGIRYWNGEVNLSEVSLKKIKAKIRRKAKGLYRWRIRNGVDFEKTARAMIRIFNRKFYDAEEEKSFSWSRWFFPLLTTSEGLQQVDAYLLEYLRYLSSGRHYKGNYRITYEKIKEMGYKSLVHEYYKGKAEKSQKETLHERQGEAYDILTRTSV